jgi:hypothetical protein
MRAQIRRHSHKRSRPSQQASPSGIAFAGNTVWLASLRGQRPWGVPVLNGVLDGNPVAFLNGTLGRLRLITVALDGSLWLMTNNTDGRGTPRAGDDRIVRVTLGSTPPRPPPPPPPPPPGTCRVTYAGSSWGGGGSFTAGVTIANTSTTGRQRMDPGVRLPERPAGHPARLGRDLGAGNRERQRHRHQPRPEPHPGPQHLGEHRVQRHLHHQSRTHRVHPQRNRLHNRRGGGENFVTW